MVRALQKNQKEFRKIWFEEVRQCRRRKRELRFASAPVSRIFAISDQYHLLQEATVRQLPAAQAPECFFTAKSRKWSPELPRDDAV